MSDVGSARRAKEELKAKISGEPWCIGTGVEREDGVGFIVRVTVKAGALDAARAVIPERIGDVRIKVIEADP